jgi:CheY-like chemotaxis protein
VAFTLLIVDDEQIILKSYARLLSVQLPTVTVLTAKNGVEGLTMIKAHKPNLVLLDLAMPEMNGFEVLAHLQDEGIAQAIIVMTAFDTQDNVELAKLISQSSQIEVLRKPVDMPVLIGKISAMMTS